MIKNINYVSHKKSKVKNNGKPQLPSANSLVEGEIAINYAKDVETLSIKNESGTVVTFSSDNYYTEKKLGSGFTESNSAVTVTSAMFEIEKAISDEAARAQAAEANRYTKSETYTKTEVNGLVSTPHQNYVTVATYADLPATGSADTIYRVSNWDGSANSGAGAVDVTVYSEYAWDDQSNPNKYVFLCVKSQIGEVFDISVYNNNAKYDTLADALGTNGEHVPQSIRRGGMSVKYVQNSDNKYVQYRYTSDSIEVSDFVKIKNWAIAVEDKFIDIIIEPIDTTSGHSAISSADGSIVYSSSAGSSVNTFNIDPSKMYEATGRRPGTDGFCMIAYYTSEGSYIGYELGYSGSAEHIVDYILTIPSNAAFVKIAGNKNTGQDGALKLNEIRYLRQDVDELSENVLVKQEQILTDQEISDVLINLKLKTKTVEIAGHDAVRGKAILLEDGTLTSASSNSVIYTFEISDLTNEYEYLASGRIPGNTEYCSIAYYDENQSYLGYEIKGNVAEDYNDYKLTIPQNAKYVKIWSNVLSHYPSLKAVTGGIIDEINEKIDNIEEELDYSIAGKTIAIIGSSIHTGGNDGAHPNAVEIEIMPEDVGVQLSAYLTYNDVQDGLTIGGVTYTSSQIGTEITFTPTADDIGKKVGVPKNYNPSTMKVWWKYLIEEFSCTIIPVCWSGSGFTRNRQGNNQYVPSYAWHDSQIRKCGIRIPGTMNRTAPDIIILARGSNDMSYEPYARLTEGYFDSPNWQYPTNDSVGEGIYGFKEGIMTTISKLRSTYPFAKILICTTTPFKRVNYSHFPMNNGLYNQQQYNKAYKEVAEFCGIDVIDFAKCGITWENMYPTYVSDSDTNPVHPNAKGHEVMAKCAIETLKNINFDL